MAVAGLTSSIAIRLPAIEAWLEFNLFTAGYVVSKTIGSKRVCWNSQIAPHMPAWPVIRNNIIQVKLNTFSYRRRLLVC